MSSGGMHAIDERPPSLHHLPPNWRHGLPCSCNHAAIFSDGQATAPM
jgi:hypothetical protein